MIKTHGMSKGHPLYVVWTNMKERCYNANYRSYYLYGARGIKICDDWKNNFINFRNWAIKNNWAKDLTIDRINNDKGYCPENCRFITQSENSKKVFIDHPGLRTGINNPRTSLTEDQVREIKKMISDGLRNCVIAKQINTNQMIISRIKNNKTWKHIK